MIFTLLHQTLARGLINLRPQTDLINDSIDYFFPQALRLV
jgi:hypothetical protein